MGYNKRQEPPSMNPYLTPLVDDLKHMWEPGKCLKTHNHPKGVLIRAALLLVAADSPALRKLLGFLAHSANYGCTKCLKKSHGKVGNKDYSGFKKSEWPARIFSLHKKNAESVKAAKTDAEAKRLETQYGCRYSEFLKLPYFNVIKHHTLDLMHSLFLGTAKHIFNLWVEQGILDDEKLDEIDRKFSKIDLPLNNGWVPKDMSQNYKYYNSYEWKNWTMNYSMLILKGLIPREHYEMWQTFVTACRKVCRPCITKDDVIVADLLFQKFGTKVTSLLGYEAVTPNMHSHCHNRECCEDFGSPYGWWLFSFERFNGILSDYNTNNKSIEKQLMKTFLSKDFLNSKYLQMPVGYSKELQPMFSDLTRTTELTAVHIPLEMLSVPKMPLHECQPHWINLAHISVPKKHPRNCITITKDDIKILRKTYSMMYAGQRIKKKHLGTVYWRYSNITVGSDKYYSKLYTKSKTDTCILASWTDEDGNITDRDEYLGEVKHFLEHSVKVGSEYKVHILAAVLWYQKLEEETGFLSPVSVHRKIRLEPGPSVFMPVQRISCKVISMSQKVNGYHCLVASPVHLKAFV